MVDKRYILVLSGKKEQKRRQFFPSQDDRYFLSGSLDGKLRLWNIPDKKVALWNEIEGVGEFDHVIIM